MVIAQDAHTGRIEDQAAAECRGGIDPPGGEYAQHMSAGENQDLAVERPKPRHDPIDPFGDLQDGLAAGTPVAEELPVWVLSMDFHECPAFVVTVIPLEQLPVERCQSGEAGELAGLLRPPQRTREHVIELQPFEPGTERASLFLTPGGKREIGSPRMLTRDSPSGLSVSREIDIGSINHESPVLAAIAP